MYQNDDVFDYNAHCKLKFSYYSFYDSRVIGTLIDNNKKSGADPGGGGLHPGAPSLKLKKI